jgi:hypothetical protein
MNVDEEEIVKVGDDESKPVAESEHDEVILGTQKPVVTVAHKSMLHPHSSSPLTHLYACTPVKRVHVEDLISLKIVSDYENPLSRIPTTFDRQQLPEFIFGIYWDF